MNLSLSLKFMNLLLSTLKLDILLQDHRFKKKSNLGSESVGNTFFLKMINLVVDYVH